MNNAPAVVVFQVEAAIRCETALANGGRNEAGESRSKVSRERVEMECRMRMVRVRAVEAGANKEQAMPGAIVVGRYLVGILCSQRQGRLFVVGDKAKPKVGDIMELLVKGEIERQQAKRIRIGQYRPGRA